LDISEHNKVDWRRQNNIPDGDGIELEQTRKHLWDEKAVRTHPDSFYTLQVLQNGYH